LAVDASKFEQQEAQRIDIIDLVLGGELEFYCTKRPQTVVTDLRFDLHTCPVVQ
jgi:hypothetical protein